jgi:uncharacterized protein (TIGR03067 family)
MGVHPLIVLVAGILIGDDGRSQSNQDFERLQGSWVAISGEADGQRFPEGAMRGFRMFVHADRITFTPQTNQRESKFELHPSKAPKEIVITPLDGPRKGRSQRGLYAFDKGRLKLCVNNEKDNAPTQFVTKRGDGLRLLVFKRLEL